MMFMVIRTDDHGTATVVRDGLTEPAAHALCETLTAKAHKQFYEVLGYRNRDERAAMMAARTATQLGDQIAGPRLFLFGLVSAAVWIAGILMIA